MAAYTQTIGGRLPTGEGPLHQAGRRIARFVKSFARPAPALTALRAENVSAADLRDLGLRRSELPSNDWASFGYMAGSSAGSGPQL